MSDESRPIEIGMVDLDEDPAPDQDPAKKRSRVRSIVLGALATVALAGVATLGYTGWKINSQKDATITIPPQIGALVLDESEDGRSTAEYLQTALSAEVDLDSAAGAVYREPAG